MEGLIPANMWKTFVKVYETTDIFVYPSRYEGYGMAAVEPMLQGIPVIVHDYPAILEAVGEGANCLPWGCDSKVWEDEIEDMLLLNLEEWREKSLARANSSFNDKLMK
jgi:glycosyltransferase involved in cell wall biosynthesis